ncbi:MAG: hypothetical protein IJD83_07825 [Clostridia bacterium]|nr:hypothetical protein [Clostridia bacterium]
MKIKTAPADVWAEYQDGIAYNHNISLYDTVKRNEKFFIGDQWSGVNAPDLDKPVFNILKRIGNMQMAYIVSDDIAVNVTPFIDDGTHEAKMKIISREIEKVIEYARIKKENRRVLRNAFVQGDGCLHYFMDMSVQTGTAAEGVIGAECLDSTNIFFGNPADNDVQHQPYIIVLMRRDVEDARKEAIREGINEKDAESNIVPDADTNMMNEEHTHDNLVSVLVKYWKEDDGVHCCITTQTETIKKEWNTGLKLYPISFMNWDEIKNCYHGQAAVTGLIPNQIFINKLFAMQMDYVKKLAFPKLIYDAGRFPNGFSNKIGEAVKVSGNVNDAITNAFKMPDLDASVMALTEKVYQYTQETMGASDAALGNIRPDNASAIVATQQATTAPLELVRRNFYQFVEDGVRIIIDLMRVHYGKRTVIVEETVADTATGAQTKQKVAQVFDFDTLNEYALNLEVNIGSSAYWSEIMQVQTSGNLLTAGVLQDPEVYIDSIPDAYLRNKAAILESVREQKKQMQTMQQPQPQMQGIDVQQMLQPAEAAVPPMQ